MTKKSSTNQKGFSLIELLIVVVIIGIIAAIAIPNLLASRRAANEASAMSCLRTIISSEFSYSATTGGGSYGDLNALFASDHLVDRTISNATVAANAKSGYVYSMTPIAPASGVATFIGGAAPAVTSGVTQTGTREFETDTAAVIYYHTGATAIPTSGTASGTAIGN